MAGPFVVSARARLETFDVVVLGAGAAGLMCAIDRRPARPARAGARPCREAGAQDPDLRRRALQLHQSSQTAPERFLSANPHFARSALAATRRRISSPWCERHGIACHEKTLGQLFCDGSARADRRHAAGRMPRRPASISALAPHARAMWPRRTHSGSKPAHGDVRRRSRGAGDRRPVDPQDRRHRFRLRHRAPVRPAR